MSEVRTARGVSTSPAQDMRDAFFGALHEIASKDRRVLLLTGDQGAFGLTQFRRDLGGQFFNVGVAEQNMVAVDADLARHRLTE